MSWNESSFKEKLENTHDFPCTYTFKFIVRPEHQAKVEALLPGTQTMVKPSSGNKYISITIRAKMKSGGEVVRVYKEAKKIEGIISL